MSFKYAFALTERVINGSPDGELLLLHRVPRHHFHDLLRIGGGGRPGLGAEQEQSFTYYTRKNFCDGLNLSEKNIRMPDGMADDIASECARYGEAIEAAGGIDMMILGIGPNAHIGFNEPGPCFVPETHVVELSEATRAANARFFDNPEDVPHWAVSMGMRDIMFSRHILLLASGAGKTEALALAVNGDITPKAPASVLQLHRGAIVIADRIAARRLPGYEDDLS